MQHNTYEYPKSSFLGMPKDVSIIMKKVLNNQNVLRLLYYNTPDCLDRQKYSDIGSTEIEEMIKNEQILTVPKIKVDDSGIKRNYLRITFDSFTQNATNDFYRDHVVEVRIVCHFDTWNLLDFDQRPYRLAGEIDAMLANQRLSGIGLLTFLGADQDVYNIEYGGLTLRYLAIRGEEDRKNPLQ